MKNFNLIACLLVTFISSQATQASDTNSETGYEVEIILFSYVNNQNLSSELWPENITLETTDITEPKTTATTEDTNVHENPLITETQNTFANTSTETEVGISDTAAVDNILEPTDIDTQADEPEAINLMIQEEYLPVEAYKLQKQADTINNSAQYNLLIHTAWKQAGLAKDKAFAIHLSSLKNEEEIATNKNIDSLKIESDTAVRTTTGINTDSQSVESKDPLASKEQEPLNDYLDGELTFIMSRYLHINADLKLHHRVKTHQTSGVDNNVISSLNYTIKFDRRMRSKEVHFIDHPLVGMLILATPFKIIKPVDEQENESATSYKTIN